MKFVAALAFAAGVAAHAKNVTYTTEVVTAYTTYCPGPTEIVHGDKTYTVTEATTLTITDCPCTVTKPVHTAPVEVCKTCNVTVPKPPTPSAPAPTGGIKPTTPPPVVAGAAKLSGAGLAAVLGAAILL